MTEFADTFPDHEAIADPSSPVDALETEIDQLATSNSERLNALQMETGSPIMGLDILYLKCCLEHLIGSYGIVQVRLLYNRQVAALCDDFEGQLPAMKLAVSQQQAALAEATLTDHLGPNGTRRRRR